ncbi:MAG TPA: right-handed parallel beta-helix repeat-containing protein [Candidatus Sulfotelmatobacter sp.]|nr:right-handed parallel beta-helix repeat-containing protein [Candidatus Sulfotelmatobacter sp.]
MKTRTIVAFLLWLTLGTGAHAQLIVDCTGADSSAYPSINAALPNAVPGSSIIVTGPCSENVSLYGVNGLNLGAWWGQTAVINGSISINNSTSIYLYGFNVTNPSGNGINVGSSKGVVVDTCTSNGNAGIGLNAYLMSDVTVSATGAFDNNASGGINIGTDALVSLVAWAGLIDISNNVGPGVYASQAAFWTLGHTTIANNMLGSPQGAGLGIMLLGGARAQVGALFGPNIIQGNPAGGASIGEGSEVSFWSAGQPNVIQSNGTTGVSVNVGSQATFFEGAQITDHTGAGVDVYGNSQANFFGANQVLRNGTSTDPLSAGIRLDGNSEALLRGGAISQNNGPGLLALVNSSADFSGVTFSGNAGGIITCDSTATMISDLALPSSTPPAGVRCKSSHALGNRAVARTQPATPDTSAYRIQQAKYKKIATKH